MRVQKCMSLILAATMTLIFTASTAAREPTTETDLSATLDGKPIPLGSAGAWPCHDFEYPIIRCFTTVDMLMSAIGPEGGDGVVAAAATTPHVTAYDFTYYGGTNPKVLSTDQEWLFLIGWNDVTSSFKSFGATGRWWENSPRGGLLYEYGATTQVPVLSSTYNNKFSAFEID